MILVTGFGPFGDVVDNPAARLARAVHGQRAGGHTVVGLVIPVSYARGPSETIAVARALRPTLVLGIGVAVGRPGPEVERIGRRVADPSRADVDGVCLAQVADADVRATIDARHLARALGARVSDDAGAYVCNAWLARVAGALPVPVGFLHVPSDGVAARRLLDALAQLV